MANDRTAPGGMGMLLLALLESGRSPSTISTWA